VTGKPEAATTVVGMLLDHCRDALTDTGDAGTGAALLTDLLARGNGASFRRSVYRRSGRLPDVINDAVPVTGSAGQPGSYPILRQAFYRAGRRFCWLGGCPLVSMALRNGLTGG
jgi:hypothetical protein